MPKFKVWLELDTEVFETADQIAEFINTALNAKKLADYADYQITARRLHDTS
jgi:hypothetical protein